MGLMADKHPFHPKTVWGNKDSYSNDSHFFNFGVKLKIIYVFENDEKPHLSTSPAATLP
jgi:hypothetical protein